MARLCFPGLYERCKFDKTDLIVSLPNESEVWFAGLDDQDRVEKILGEIAARQLMKSGGIVAVERETRQSPFSWPMGFEPLKEREYGIATIYYAVAKDEEKSRQ